MELKTHYVALPGNQNYGQNGGQNGGQNLQMTITEVMYVMETWRKKLVWPILTAYVRYTDLVTLTVQHFSCENSLALYIMFKFYFILSQSGAAMMFTLFLYSRYTRLPPLRWKLLPITIITDCNIQNGQHPVMAWKANIFFLIWSSILRAIVWIGMNFCFADVPAITHTSSHLKRW